MYSLVHKRRNACPLSLSPDNRLPDLTPRSLLVRQLVARCGLSSWSRSQADGGVLGENEWRLNQLALELVSIAARN